MSNLCIRCNGIGRIFEEYPPGYQLKDHLDKTNPPGQSPTRMAAFEISLDYLRNAIGLPPEYEIVSLYMDPESSGKAIAHITGFDLKKVIHGSKLPLVQVIIEKVAAHIEYIEGL